MIPDSRASRGTRRLARGNADRRGFVLIIVVLLTALGGILVMGLLNGSAGDAALARLETMQRRVLSGAESAAWGAFTGADASALRHRPPGPVSVVTRVMGDMTLIASVDKADTSVIWIVATATIQRGRRIARHRIGITALIPHDTTDLTLHLVPERAWVELF